MARDSQPPPPQLIADLQERLDALQAEYDEHRQHTQDAIEEAVRELRDEYAATQRELIEAKRMLEEVKAVVKERDDEIAYLQGQLESAVNDLEEYKFGKLSGGNNGGAEAKSNGTNTPLRIMADMKQRLHSLEDRLSTCNLTQRST